MGTAQIKRLPVEHDIEDDDSLYPSRMPSSVRRYKPSQPTPISPGVQDTPPTASSASPSTRSTQGGRTRPAVQDKKSRPLREPDAHGEIDGEQQEEPITQAPVVPRRRASLESEQQQTTAAMQALRAPTSGRNVREAESLSRTNGAGGANASGADKEGSVTSVTGALRSPTSGLKNVPTKASEEKAATAKIPSAALAGRLPNTDALPQLGRFPMVAILIGMIAAIVLVMIFGAFSSWWRVYQDDLRYGRPRTYQIDAVVGHGDSVAHKTHFIFLNLNRHVEIVEIDGGDPSHTHIYEGPVLFGDGQDLTPVTGEIRDVNGDGKPDLIVHIQDQQIIYINNGTTFQPQSTTP